MHTQFWLEIPKEGGNLEDLGIDDRILELILWN